MQANISSSNQPFATNCNPLLNITLAGFADIIWPHRAQVTADGVFSTLTDLYEWKIRLLPASDFLVLLVFLICNKVMACCCGSCWPERFHFEESTVSLWLMGLRWTSWLCPSPRPVPNPSLASWRVSGTKSCFFSLSPLEAKSPEIVWKSSSESWLLWLNNLWGKHGTVSAPGGYVYERLLLKMGRVSTRFWCIYPLPQKIKPLKM